LYGTIVPTIIWFAQGQLAKMQATWGAQELRQKNAAAHPSAQADGSGFDP
jgi:hypothetical protein